MTIIRAPSLSTVGRHENSSGWMSGLRLDLDHVVVRLAVLRLRLIEHPAIDRVLLPDDDMGGREVQRGAAG